MSKKEASARLKINEMLSESGWRLTDKDGTRANVDVENHVKLDQLGDDFENTPNGFIDYLLLDENQKPIAVEITAMNASPTVMLDFTSNPKLIARSVNEP